MRRYAWLAILVGAIGLYVYEFRGPLETIRGEVVGTHTYPHQDHTHAGAVIEYEGERHGLSRDDRLTRGQKVWVNARRGRLSGRLRFVSLRDSVPLGATSSGGGAAGPRPSIPEPWAYDRVEDRHWNPDHGHWHDGPPPPAARR